MLCYKYITTPLGEMLLLASPLGLRGAWFHNQKYYPQIPPTWTHKDTPPLLQAQSYLSQYFSGHNPSQPPELDLKGTDFQLKVWRQLLNVHYGKTKSYKQIAEAILQPTATRAVSGAIGRNPISVIVPCHRVVSSKNQLTGYAGGVDKKAWMLKLEGVEI